MFRNDLDSFFLSFSLLVYLTLTLNSIIQAFKTQILTKKQQLIDMTEILITHTHTQTHAHAGVRSIRDKVPSQLILGDLFSEDIPRLRWTVDKKTNFPWG